MGKTNVFGISLIASTLLLAGCQTTSGLETAQARLAKQITSQLCKIVSSNEIHKKDPGLEGMTVYSITERPGGWLAADISTHGLYARPVRGNVYYNRSTGEFACGTKSWRQGQETKQFRTSPIVKNGLVSKGTDPVDMFTCLKPDNTPYENKQTKIMCAYLGGTIQTN